MAKEINIARLSVDMIANTATYRSQMADLIKQTDKRLKQLEKIHGTSSAAINKHDITAAARATKIAKERAKAETDAYAMAARMKNQIRVVEEQQQVKSARRSANRMTQAGFQIQDSIVQYQGNIQATTIIAQQGSQFLGAFGTAGALAGAALAGAAVLVGIFNKSGIEAEKVAKAAGDEVRELVKAMMEHDQLGASAFDTSALISASTKEIKEKTKAIKEQGEVVITAAAAVASSFKTANGKNATAIRKTAEERKIENEAHVKEVLLYGKLKSELESLNKVKDGFDKHDLDAEKRLTNLKSQVSELENGTQQHKINEMVRKNVSSALIAEIVQTENLITSLEEKKKLGEDAAAAIVAAAKKAADAQTRNADSINQTIEKLKIQNAEYGKSGSALAAYRIGLKGATDEQKKEIITLTEALELKKSNTKADLDAARVKKQMSQQLIAQQTSSAGAGITDPLAKLEAQRVAEQAALASKYDGELQQHEDFMALKAGIDAKYALQKASAEEARMTAILDSEISLITKMSALATSQGNQLQEDATDVQKGIFLAEQGLLIASTIMNTEAAAVKAMTVDPYGILSAQTRVMGGISVGIIAAQTMGQFHGGTDALPQSMNNKSFMLKAGERVVQPEANKKLTKFLDSGEVGGGGGGGITINAPVTMGPSLVDEKVMAQALGKQQSMIANIVKKEAKNRPQRNRG